MRRSLKIWTATNLRFAIANRLTLAADASFICLLKGVRLLARIFPMLAPALASFAKAQTVARLSRDRKYARITSLGELPSDAAFFVVHERESIWIYPCESKAEAAKYLTAFRKGQSAVSAYQGIPDRLDSNRKWMYYPALVPGGAVVTPRRQKWIDAMQARENERLKIKLGVRTVEHR